MRNRMNQPQEFKSDQELWEAYCSLKVEFESVKNRLDIAERKIDNLKSTAIRLENIMRVSV